MINQNFDPSIFRVYIKINSILHFNTLLLKGFNKKLIVLVLYNLKQE